MNLLLATSNEGKRRELLAAFDGLPIRLLIPSECGIDIEIVEDGDSYLENARKKAVGYFEAAKKTAATSADKEDVPSIDAVLADDSGIEVDALDGGPGIHSARYAGVTGAGASAANNQKLLRALEGADTLEQRGARFRCLLVFWDGKQEHVAEGVWEGTIGMEPRGSEGFGYDPVFRLQDGRHAAELRPDEKFPICHRGIAASKMHDWLRARNDGS